MKKTKKHHIDKKERETIEKEWENVIGNLPKFGAKRVYHSGQVIPKSGLYTIHNSTGKLLLHETLYLQAKEDLNGTPARFARFGVHSAWYLSYDVELKRKPKNKKGHKLTKH